MTGKPGKRLDGRSWTDPAVLLARRFVEVRGLRCLAVLLSGLLVFPLGSARADVASAPLQVSAQVLPHASLQAAASAVSFLVTAADVERGYVDVRRHYLLQTNAPDRVAVQIHPRVGLAVAVDVAGFASPLRLLDTSLEVTVPAGRDLDLSFRLWLNDGVAPGEYPLPLQLAAVVR
ncbi:MAG TPA: hypothetical protein VF851_00110 [Steroidobacteraceae bacterium]